MIVWNATQAAEARELHRVAPERIAVTGAQPFDRWFERKPSTDYAAFCAKVGLPDDRMFVLFAGSTAGISHPDDEHIFVRHWIEQVRKSGDPTVRDVGILIRPHPYNPGNWRNADLSGLASGQREALIAESKRIVAARAEAKAALKTADDFHPSSHDSLRRFSQWGLLGSMSYAERAASVVPKYQGLMSFIGARQKSQATTARISGPWALSSVCQMPLPAVQ